MTLSEHDSNKDAKEAYTELVYLSSSGEYPECSAAIFEAFPHAEIKDASDIVHEHRFSVSLPESDRAAFFKLACREGFALCCLSVQLATYHPPQWMKDALTELSQEQTEPDQAPSDRG